MTIRIRGIIGNSRPLAYVWMHNRHAYYIGCSIFVIFERKGTHKRGVRGYDVPINTTPGHDKPEVDRGRMRWRLMTGNSRARQWGRHAKTNIFDRRERKLAEKPVQSAHPSTRT